MVELYEAAISDHADIMALFGRHGFAQQTYAEWIHLWQNNPVLEEINYAWPIGWVLKNTDSQIVGYFGNYPIPYEFKGKRLIAAVAHAWVVDMEYRKYSILLVNSYFRQKEPDLLLNTTGGNPVTQKVFLAYKAQKAPVESYDRSLFSILNHKEFAVSLFKKKKLPVWLVNNPISSFLFGGFDQISKLQFRFFSFNKQMVQQCESFDSKFDIFWEELKKQSGKLLCVRNARQLHWHFNNAIHQKKVWIFKVEKKNRIVSYAIFIRDDNLEIDLKRVRLVDLQTIENSNDNLLSILSAAKEKGFKEGVYMIESIGFDLVKRNIIAHQFTKKRELTVWPFYSSNDLNLRKELKKSKVWELSFFDGDGSL
ncbi:MAG: hypothetical protein ABIJ59_06210 [Pseudomonadota bacterium]